MTATSSGRELGARDAGSPVLPLISAPKIMFVGDSWTAQNSYAIAIEAGWRLALDARLTAAGVAHDFVGPFSDGAFPEPLHAGVNGTTLTAINAAIGAWLTAHTPDVVVLWAGINDSVSSGATIDSRMATLLATMWAAYPSCRVVATIIPTAVSDAARVTNLVDATTLFATTFAASSYAGAGRLRVCDARGCVPTMSAADAYDSIPHPSTLGYARCADALWPVLLNALGRNAEW